jgi:hypothetical protein
MKNKAGDKTSFVLRNIKDFSGKPFNIGDVLMGTMAVNKEVLGELVGPLPGGIYWTQGAMSYFGKARKVWKKLERVELTVQYQGQMKVGIVGNAALDVVKDFVPAVGIASSALGLGEGKMMLRCEYMVVSVWNCTEQTNRFYSSLRALKDALSMNRQMPPRLENKLNSVKLANEEGLAKKVVWLFSPSSTVWVSQQMILVAWRVGQISEAMLWVVIDGFKLSMYCMDVMEAYHFSDETKKAIEDNELVYGAMFAAKGSAVLKDGKYMADHVIEFIKTKDPTFEMAGAVVQKLKEKAGIFQVV